MRHPFLTIRTARSFLPTLLPRPSCFAIVLTLALGLCACGRGGQSDVEKVSKPALTEQDIRKYLAAYRDLQDNKQKALRANAPDEYAQEQNEATMQRNGLSVSEFTFIGARIDNAFALLLREHNTPIPEAYKADCELVRRMKKEIDDVRRPIPYP